MSKFKSYVKEGTFRPKSEEERLAKSMIKILQTNAKKNKVDPKKVLEYMISKLK